MALVGAALVLAIGAGGCAIVPTNGNPVGAKEESNSDPLSQPYVRTIASPPKPGGQPQEIVDGFRAAMAAVDDPGWRIAKQYLTSEASDSWNPWAGVRILDQSNQSEKAPKEEIDGTSATVSIQGTLAGTIDPDGHHRDLRVSSQEADIAFQLTRIGKEWRISGLPAGLVLSSADVQRAYRTFNLYYPDISERWLVADQVTIPIDPGKSQAETLIRRMLKGPSRSVQGAVADLLPAGTRLNRVTTDGDSVIVDFNSRITAISSKPATRIRAVAAQIAWTLGPLVPGPIQIRVNGEPLAGLNQSIKWGSYQDFNPVILSKRQQAFFMRGGVLHRLDADGKYPAVDGAAGEAKWGGFSSPAVSGGSDQVAALGADGGLHVATMTEGSRWEEWVPSAKGALTPPSWDRYGVVWTAENATRGLRVWAAKGTPAEPVTIPVDLADAHVSKLRVARDSARVAVIVDGREGTQVKIGAIVKKNGGTRIQGTETLVEAKQGQTIEDIAWKDGQQLVVLSQSRNGRVYTVYSIGDGRSDAPKSATNVSTISAIGDLILAGGEEGGEVLSWDSKKNDWKTEIKDGASSPIYPLG